MIKKNEKQMFAVLSTHYI